MKSFYNIWTKSNNVFSKCKCCIILSSFVVWVTIFIAMLFPLFGLGLAFFVMCFLCVGLKKNVLDCIKGEQIKVENVFNYFKKSLVCFCLKVCSTFLALLWSLLLIVPGIVAALNYSFASYILTEDTSLGTLECLDLSKKLVYGKRAELFLIYLTEFLMIVLFLLFFACQMIILNFVIVMPIWLKILVPIAITMILFLIFVQPYFEIIIANMYLDAKNTEKKSTKQKSAKSVSKD